MSQPSPTAIDATAEANLRAGTRIEIKPRPRCERTYQAALQAGLSPLLAGIVAARLPDFSGALEGIVRPSLKFIERPALLADGVKAAQRLAQAVVSGERIGILTDYDVDGITSHVVIYRSLTEFFRVPPARVHSLIGHRLQDGYGVSAGLTERILALPERPQLIITADCGSSDEARIQRLQAAGIDVIVTDHHALPVEGPPASAYAVVNPTRPDCDYPDATIAGCMVAWLVMAQLRAELIAQDWLSPDAPKLSPLLAYVALGTVADCVSLAASAINRAVVNIGLALINRFEQPCWRAMRTLLNREGQAFGPDTLGFQIGPRINARGRLADPYAALHYLLAGTDQEALHYLQTLDRDNQDRKEIERQMVEAARDKALAQIGQGRSALVTYLDDGHAGVQGIVASRLMQAYGRPAIVLCNTADPQQLTGSARSIDGLHIRDALQAVHERQPDLLVKFGGHRGAAGLTIWRAALDRFSAAFEQAVRDQLGPAMLNPVIWTDGPLPPELLKLDTLYELERLQPFGREFEAPLFEGVFQVDSVRAVGADAVHLSMELSSTGDPLRAIWFRALVQEGAPFPFGVGDHIRCAYRLSLNEFRGQRTLQLMVEHAERLA